jgi:hypothetical protein
MILNIKIGNMKKSLLLGFIAFVFSVNMNAQFSFGAGLTYDLGDNIGIRGVGALNIDESWKGQASFSYFFDNDVSIWAIDIDAHYKLIEIANNEDFVINPFAGLNIANVGVDVGNTSVSNTELGINLGIQLLAPISDNNLLLFIEPKLVIKGIEGFVISAGVFF